MEGCHVYKHILEEELPCHNNGNHASVPGYLHLPTMVNTGLALLLASFSASEVLIVRQRTACDKGPCGLPTGGMQQVKEKMHLDTHET